MPAKTQSEIERDCREKILAAAPEITNALIEQAKKASYQHAKFLFDFAFTPAWKAGGKDKQEDELPGPSLAEILIGRLDELLAEDPSAEGNEDCDT